MINKTDYILKNSVHLGWDNSFEPALKIAPGDVVEFEAQDGSGGQLNVESKVEDVTNLDFESDHQPLCLC